MLTARKYENLGEVIDLIYKNIQYIENTPRDFYNASGLMSFTIRNMDGYYFSISILESCPFRDVREIQCRHLTLHLSYGKYKINNVSFEICDDDTLHIFKSPSNPGPIFNIIPKQHNDQMILKLIKFFKLFRYKKII